MKGIVFSEFLDLVEDKFGLDLLDSVIDACSLESGAAYTAVGTYDHQELIALVVELSQRSGVEVPDLVRAFGQHLFGRLAQAYPQLVSQQESLFGFLTKVETYIHVEVRKLYPEAELPTISYELAGDQLTLDYESSRPFADLAEGLLLGAAEFFGESIDIRRDDRDAESGTSARFVLTAKSGVESCQAMAH